MKAAITGKESCSCVCCHTSKVICVVAILSLSVCSVCGGGARSGKQKRKRGRLQQRLLQQLLWRLTPQPLLVSSSLNRLNSTTKGMDANLKLSGPTNLCIQGRSCCSVMCCVETDRQTDRQAGRQADRPTDRRQINRQTNLQTDSLTRSRRERTSDSCPPDKQVHGISLDILCLHPKASVTIQWNLEGHTGLHEAFCLDSSCPARRCPCVQFTCIWYM